MGILLLRVSVRCDVVRTIIFDRVGLFGLILHVAGSGDGSPYSSAGSMIVLSAEAGFGAALTPPL